MAARADVMELESIRTEIKRLAKELRELRKTEKVVETRIISYLNETNQPGVKYTNTAVVLHEKTPTKPKKKADKIADMGDVLRRYGVTDIEKAIADIDAARKGEKIIEHKINIQKFKN